MPSDHITANFHKSEFKIYTRALDRLLESVREHNEGKSKEERISTDRTLGYLYRFAGTLEADYDSVFNPVSEEFERVL